MKILLQECVFNLRLNYMTDDKNSSEEKINFLIKIAFEKGVEKAVKEAKKLNDPYILDEFHDRLIKKLEEEAN